MLKRIKDFFEAHLVPKGDGDDADAGHMLRLATAALLLEMVNMDGERRPEQCEAVKAGVSEHFGLDEEEAAELLELAEAELVESTDYFQFTSLINSAYTPEQKGVLVEKLWHIAYANELLHVNEEHLVRKIADLLHVPHAAFIAAKHRAQSNR